MMKLSGRRENPFMEQGILLRFGGPKHLDLEEEGSARRVWGRARLTVRGKSRAAAMSV